MLKFLTGRKRSRNAFLIFFIGVLTLSLIGLFSVVVGGGAPGLFGGSGETATVARVGGYKVSVKEMRDALTIFGQQMNMGQGRMTNTDPRQTYGMFGAQVLDSLIRKKLIQYEAERLNIEATDADVHAKIRQFFNPWPGPDQYRFMIQQQYNMTPIDYEEQLLRPSIAEEHLRSYITAAVQVSSEEVKEEYRRNNTVYNIRWVEVRPENLVGKVQVNEADLPAYFEQRKGEFKIESEQRRAKYIFVDQAKAGEAVQISDEELKKTFDASPDQFVQQVRVSQIVLNVPKEKEQDVRSKAQGLIQRARGAEGKPAEDFAALAREASDDAATKGAGGDIGYVNKKDHKEAGDPLLNVFSLKAGDVSEPIKKDDKYYIFKVTERKVGSFAEARQQLIETARAGKSYDKAVEIAREAEGRLKEVKDADAVAAELNRKHGAQIVSVRDTGFFAMGEELPEIEDAPDFQSAIFELQATGEVTTWVNVKSGFAVAHYLEKRDPHEPAFEEVRDRVAQRYRQDKARELAAEIARNIARAKTPDEIKQVTSSVLNQYNQSGAKIDQQAVRMDERAGIRLGETIGALVSEADRDAVYKLQAGQITAEPVKTENDIYVVAAMLNRQEPDMTAEFETQRKSLEDSLLAAKRNTYFLTYLEMSVQKLKAEGTIQVYQEKLDENFGGGMTLPTSPQGQPQVPPPGGLPAAPRQRPTRSPQGPSPGALPGR
jgi:peptidyl-prolyl cis-trans isomerase D